MVKRIFVAIVILALIAALYILQFSTIFDSDSVAGPNLDSLQVDESDVQWAPFFKVRATIIDGQHAKINIPKVIREKENNNLEFTGACIFNANGCSRTGDTVAISEFYLVPTAGIAESCEVLPDKEMTWKIKTILSESLDLYYEDMIGLEVRVNGKFQIDESNPYDAVFFLKDATVKPIISENK